MDKELREKLENYQRGGCKDCKLASPWTMACGYEHRTTSFCPKDINQILALFPEWAKANGYLSPKEVAEMDKRELESERMLNREAAYEESRLRDEINYWKDKAYELGRT